MEKPTLSQRISSFATFIYNSSEGKVLGRGPRSWCEITVFYVIFFACLAGFFAATMAGFYQTIEEEIPRLQGTSSLLRANPGMGYKPMPDMDTTLIYARMPEKDNIEYVKNINGALKEYKDANLAGSDDCSNVQTVRENDLGKVACAVDFEALTKGCNETNAYGMAEGKPCILLKLNRIYNWVPEVWTEEEAKDVKVIPDKIKANYTTDRIWIECHGENPADNDNLGLDDIEYFPQQGFPLAYYPYMNQKNYRSPLVFVKFNNAIKHLALMIECKALAKNIAVDRTPSSTNVVAALDNSVLHTLQNVLVPTETPLRG